MSLRAEFIIIDAPALSPPAVSYVTIEVAHEREVVAAFDDSSLTPCPAAHDISEISCALYDAERYLGGWSLYPCERTLELVDADKKITSRKVTLAPCVTGRELLQQGWEKFLGDGDAS